MSETSDWTPYVQEYTRNDSGSNANADGQTVVDALCAAVTRAAGECAASLKPSVVYSREREQNELDPDERNSQYIRFSKKVDEHPEHYKQLWHLVQKHVAALNARNAAAGRTNYTFV